jgi:acetyl-CoA carboxylase carboxyltransferase component
MSLVSRSSAAAKGQPFDEEADASMRAMVEEMIGQQSAALAMSGRLYDDGVIDPRDTRTVLGLCLWLVTRETPAHAAEGAYGVFRM